MAEVSAIQGRLVAELSPGYGFMGFLVAWLAGGGAVGIVVMAFVFAVLSSIGDVLQITQGVPYSVINLLMAAILFIVLIERGKGGGAMTPPFFVAALSSAILSGTSLLYATLGELVGERAGIVNLGLEGLMLIGASTGFAAASLTLNPYLGVAAAALAGVAANCLFGYVVISRHANQLAAGLSLMFFGLGASALIGRPFVGALAVGLPRLGAFDALVWLALPTAALLWGILYRTRWGLALRAVGEAPAVAFAAGRGRISCSTRR